MQCGRCLREKIVDSCALNEHLPSSSFFFQNYSLCLKNIYRRREKTIIQVNEYLKLEVERGRLRIYFLIILSEF